MRVYAGMNVGKVGRYLRLYATKDAWKIGRFFGGFR